MDNEKKYAAVWISHSSISDFLTCPRSYYYANIYKNPRSGKKITLMNPYLALGQSVHEVLESLSIVPAEKRFKEPLLEKFHTSWMSVSGKRGGFLNESEELAFRKRGEEMLQNVMNHPGPLLNKTVKMKQDLPYFWLSEKENIILCGKIDWLEYIEETGCIHIIDFKTGKRDEKEDSLQLPIYYLLVKNCQTRPLTKMSYWYLDRDTAPKEVPIPDEKKSLDELMKIGMRMKLARQLNHFKCSINEQSGCRACAPYEAVVKGKGEYIGLNKFDREIYILPEKAVTL